MKCIRYLLLHIILLSTLAMASQSVLGSDSPLINIEALKMKKGPITSYSNVGTLKGSFTNNGTQPIVKVVAGEKAIVFDANDYLVSDFLAPTNLTGTNAWTCIIRTYCKDITGERTLFSWANRPNNCIELEYGTAKNFGALGSWSHDVADWGGSPPITSQWHTIVYSYAGGEKGTFQIWVDGVKYIDSEMSLNIKANCPFVIGACMNSDPGKDAKYTHFIEGAISTLKLYNKSFNSLQIWNASGYESASLFAPKYGAVF